MTGEASVWVLSDYGLREALQRVADGDSPMVVLAEIYANAAPTPVRPVHGIWRLHCRYQALNLGPGPWLVDAYCFHFYDLPDAPMPSARVSISVERFWSVAP